MRKNNIITLCVSAICAAGSPSFGIDGLELPEPGTSAYNDRIELYTALEAVCGIGRTINLTGLNGPTQEHNTYVTGVLVAPNIVLTAGHGFGSIAYNESVDPSDPRMQAVDPDTGDPLFDSNGVPVPMFTVRFRLQPDGSVGSYAGGPGSFYQAPIKRVIKSDFGLDMALAVLADGVNDTDDHGVWQDGWVSHITPIPVAPIKYDTTYPRDVVGAAMGPTACDPGDSSCDPQFGDQSTRGQLRYAELFDIPFRAGGGDCPSYSVFRDGLAQTFEGDSGGGWFFQTDEGKYILGAAWSGGYSLMNCVEPGTVTWNRFFGPYRPLGTLEFQPEYGVPHLLSSEFDVTKDAWPGSFRFGRPGFSIDLDDLLALSAQDHTALHVDWNGDRTVDSSDFTDCAAALLGAANPFMALPVLPLPPASADVNSDGRFNQHDTAELSSRIGDPDPDLRFDYSGDGIIDQDDLDSLQALLTSNTDPGDTWGAFSHGLFGDFDADEDVDPDDYASFASLDPSLFLFSTVDDPGYGVRLDVDVNKYLDDRDFVGLTARFLPGDVTNGVDYDPFSISPDGSLTLFDARVYALHAAISIADDVPDPLLGIDVVDDRWLGTGTYLPPDGRVTKADVLWTLESWAQNHYGSAFSIPSRFDFEFLDANGDGRTNILDMREILADTGYDPDWDFDNNGDIGTTDLNAITSIVRIQSPFGQGFLGDFDGSASPSCECDALVGVPSPSYFFCQDDASLNDLCGPLVVLSADCQDLAQLVNDTSGYFVTSRSYGDPDYLVQLDGDLDGDIDLDDRPIVFHELQPGDLDFDGDVDASDAQIFGTVFQASYGSSEGDPGYDLRADMDRDGSVTIYDIGEFNAWYANPKCN